jgi:hypothetical protein
VGKLSTREEISSLCGDIPTSHENVSSSWEGDPGSHEEKMFPCDAKTPSREDEAFSCDAGTCSRVPGSSTFMPVLSHTKSSTFSFSRGQDEQMRKKDEYACGGIRRRHQQAGATGIASATLNFTCNRNHKS